MITSKRSNKMPNRLSWLCASQHHVCAQTTTYLESSGRFVTTISLYVRFHNKKVRNHHQRRWGAYLMYQATKREENTEFISHNTVLSKRGQHRQEQWTRRVSDLYRNQIRRFL